MYPCGGGKVTKLEAIEASMKQWEVDIIQRFLDGHAIDAGCDELWDNGESVKDRSSHCALCGIFFHNPSIAIGERCGLCPLFIYSKGCDTFSPWDEWRCNKDLETAINMWSFLCLLREIEIQGE
jgi:hypothetical protein